MKHRNNIVAREENIHLCLIQEQILHIRELMEEQRAWMTSQNRQIQVLLDDLTSQNAQIHKLNNNLEEVVENQTKILSMILNSNPIISHLPKNSFESHH
jgi:cell division protein FtsB